MASVCVAIALLWRFVLDTSSSNPSFAVALIDARRSRRTWTWRQARGPGYEALSLLGDDARGWSADLVLLPSRPDRLRANWDYRYGLGR